MQPSLHLSRSRAERSAPRAARTLKQLAVGVAAMAMTVVTFEVFVEAPARLEYAPGSATTTLARGSAIFNALAHLNSVNRKEIR